MPRSLHTTFASLALCAVFLAAGCGDDEDTDISDAGDTDADADAGPLSDGVAINVVNDAADTRYIYWGISNDLGGETALGCALSADGAGASWEPCRITADCYHPCSGYAPGDICSNECEPDYFYREIPPGASLEISWDARLVVLDSDYCSEGACADTVYAATGMYRLSITVYPDIDCGAIDCEADTDGFYTNAMPADAPTMFFVDVPLPSADTDHEIAIGD